MAADVKTGKFCFKLRELNQSRREASTLNSKRDSKVKKMFRMAEKWRQRCVYCSTVIHSNLYISLL